MWNKILRPALPYLPRSLRHKAIRHFIRIDEAGVSDVTFKLAETKEELEAAFRLLHDAYVDEGYMDPHPSGMRVTPYHALPTTTTLIAVLDGKVVGTVSVIADGGFGFPMEKLFDTKAFRDKGMRIAEVSSLAVDKGMRTRGKLVFPLFRYTYQYLIKYLGVDVMIICIHPNKADHFEALMHFERIDHSDPKAYDFVNGNPALGLFNEMRKLYKRGQSSKRPMNRCLSRFMTAAIVDDRYRFPARELSRKFDGVMTPELLEHFFIHKTEAFKHLTPAQVEVLHYLYRSSAHRAVLPALPASGLKERRSLPRFNASCTAVLDIAGKRTIRMRLVDVSEEGFRAILEEPIRFGGTWRLQVSIDDRLSVALVAMPVWTSGAGVFGFKIVATESRWQDFVRDLERQSWGKALSA